MEPRTSDQPALVASQRMRVAFLLTLAGGFLDAYTYVERGGVFANAQTGNIENWAFRSSTTPTTSTSFISLPFARLRWDSSAPSSSKRYSTADAFLGTRACDAMGRAAVVPAMVGLLLVIVIITVLRRHNAR